MSLSAPLRLPRERQNDPLYDHWAGDSVGVAGLVLTPHYVTVPLSYDEPFRGNLNVFFRVVSGSNTSKSADKAYYLLYLQGGPGFEGPRPTEASGWLGKAVQYFNVVLLDQRGTGNSTPVSSKSLERLGSPENQAAYLQHFRADSIIRDAEVIRSLLVGPGGQWSVLGQSFGGFCCLHYLCTAPNSLSEVLLTGGIPPRIDAACAAADAYERLYRRVITQNRKFYARFPGDIAVVQRIVTHLDGMPEGGALLPNGGTLTPRALQLLGLAGLGSAGGFERLHFLLERAFDDGELSPHFLMSFTEWMPWASNPLYALLHESIYCQGHSSCWAAWRVMQEQYSKEFDAVAAVQLGSPVYFTGEMIFPWMFDDLAELRPLRAVAQLLAFKSDWPRLYDQSVLAAINTPVAAMCYFEDMYVEFDLAQETAARIKGIRQWVTNEFMHSGIQEDGPKILETLLGMARGSKPLF